MRSSLPSSRHLGHAKRQSGNFNERRKLNSFDSQLVPSCSLLDRQNHLHTHILTGVHQFAIDNGLVHTNTVVHRIGRIRRRCNLYLAPLTICRSDATRGSSLLELFVDALLFDAAFSLNEWRV